MGNTLTPDFRHKRPTFAVINTDNMVLAAYGAALKWMAEEQIKKLWPFARVVEWFGPRPHVGDVLRGIDP